MDSFIMDIGKRRSINSKSVIQNPFFRFIVQSYLFLIQKAISSSNKLLRRPTDHEKNNFWAYANFVLEKIQAVLGIVVSGIPLLVMTLATPVYSLGHALLFGMYSFAGRLLGFESPAPQSVKDFNIINRILWSSVITQGRAFLYFLFQLSWNGVGLGWSISKDFLKTMTAAGSVSDFMTRSNEKIWGKKERALEETVKDKDDEISLDLLPVVLGLMEIVNHIPHHQMFHILCPKKGEAHAGIYELIDDLLDPFNQQSVFNKILDHAKAFADILDLLKESDLFASVLKGTDKTIINNMLEALIDLTIAIQVQNLEKQMGSHEASTEQKGLISQKISEIKGLKDTIKESAKHFVLEVADRGEEDIKAFQKKLFSPLSEMLRALEHDSKATHTAKLIGSQKAITREAGAHLLNTVVPYVAKMPLFEIAGGFLSSESISSLGGSFFNLTEKQKEGWKSLGLLVGSLQSSSTELLHHFLTDLFTDQILLASQDLSQMSLSSQLSVAEHLVAQLERAMETTNPEDIIRLLEELYNKKAEGLDERKDTTEDASHFLFDLISPLWPESMDLFKEPVKIMLSHFVLALKENNWNPSLFEEKKKKVLVAIHAALNTMKQPEHLSELSAQRYIQESKKSASSQVLDLSPVLGDLLGHFYRDISSSGADDTADEESVLGLQSSTQRLRSASEMSEREVLVIASDVLKYRDRQAFELLLQSPELLETAIVIMSRQLSEDQNRDARAVLIGLLERIKAIQVNSEIVKKYFDSLLLERHPDLQKSYQHFVPTRGKGSKDHQFFKTFYEDNPLILEERKAYSAYDWMLDHLNNHPLSEDIPSLVNQLWENERSLPNIPYFSGTWEREEHSEPGLFENDQPSIAVSTIGIAQHFLTALGPDSPMIQPVLLAITPDILEHGLTPKESMKGTPHGSEVSLSALDEPLEEANSRDPFEANMPIEIPVQKVVAAYKILHQAIASMDRNTFAKEQSELLENIMPLFDIAKSYIDLENQRTRAKKETGNSVLADQVIWMEDDFNQDLLSFIQRFPFHKMKTLLDPQMQAAVFEIIEEMLPSVLANQLIKSHLSAKEKIALERVRSSDRSEQMMESVTSASRLKHGDSPRTVLFSQEMDYDIDEPIQTRAASLSSEELGEIHNNTARMSAVLIAFLKELSRDLSYRYSAQELEQLKNRVVEIAQIGSGVNRLLALKNHALKRERLSFEEQSQIHDDYNRQISLGIREITATMKNLPLGLFEVIHTNQVLWDMLREVVPPFVYNESDREWAHCTIGLLQILSQQLSGLSKQEAEEIRSNIFEILDHLSDHAESLQKLSQDPNHILKNPSLSVLEKLITTLSQLGSKTLGTLLDKPDFILLLIEVLKPYMPKEYRHLMTEEYFEQIKQMIKDNPSIFDRSHPLSFLIKFIQSLQSPAAQNLLERYEYSKKQACALKNRAFLQNILLDNDPIAFERYKAWMATSEYQQWNERRSFLNPLMPTTLEYKAEFIEQAVSRAERFEDIQSLNIENWIHHNEEIAANYAEEIVPGQPHYSDALRALQKEETFAQSLFQKHARIMMAVLKKENKAKENYASWIETKEYAKLREMRASQNIDPLVSNYEQNLRADYDEVLLEEDKQKLLSLYSRDLPEDLPLDIPSMIEAITKPELWPALIQLLPILEPLLVGPAYEDSFLRAKSNPSLDRDKRLLNGAHGLMVFLCGVLSGTPPLEMYEALTPSLEKDHDLAIGSYRRSQEEDKEAAAFPLLLDAILLRVKEMSQFRWEPISEHSKILSKAFSEEKQGYISDIMKLIEEISSIHSLYEAAMMKGFGFDSSSFSSHNRSKLEKDLGSLSLDELSKRRESIRHYKAVAQLPHAIGSVAESLLIPDADRYKHKPEALLNFIKSLYLIDDQEERLEKIRDFDAEFFYYSKDLYGPKEQVLSRLFVKWQNAFATSSLSEEQWLLAHPIPKIEDRASVEKCGFDPFAIQIDHILTQEIMKYEAVPKLLEHLSLEIISMMQSVYLMQQADPERVSDKSAASIVQFILEQFYSYGNPGQDGTMIRDLLDYAMKNFSSARVFALANAVGRGYFPDIIIATFSKQTPAIDPPEFDKEMITKFLANDPKKTALFIAKNILVPFGKDHLPLGKLNDMERMFESDLLCITEEPDKMESLCEGLFLLMYEVKHLKVQSLSKLIPSLERIFTGLRPLIEKEPPSEMLAYLLGECPQIQELLCGNLKPYKDVPGISNLLKAIESLGDRSDDTDLDSNSNRRKAHDLLKAIDAIVWDFHTIQSSSSSYAEKGVLLGYYGVALPAQTAWSYLYSWTVGMPHTFVETMGNIANALDNPFDIDLDCEDKVDEEVCSGPLLFDFGTSPSQKRPPLKSILEQSKRPEHQSGNRSAR